MCVYVCEREFVCTCVCMCICAYIDFVLGFMFIFRNCDEILIILFDSNVRNINYNIKNINSIIGLCLK